MMVALHDITYVNHELMASNCNKTKLAFDRSLNTHRETVTNHNETRNETVQGEIYI